MKGICKKCISLKLVTKCIDYVGIAAVITLLPVFLALYKKKKMHAWRDCALCLCNIYEIVDGNNT